MQPSTVVPSENLITRTEYWSTETQSFVKRVNRKGDSSQSVGHKYSGRQDVHSTRTVQNPVTDGRMYIQQGKFIEQLVGDDGVSSFT